MGATYNASVANLVDPLSNSPLNSPSHSNQHTEINDALQTLGVWTTFTPTWTSLTVGNATQSFAYFEFNKTMFVRGHITLGSTSAVATTPRFTIPNGGTAVQSSYGVAEYGDAGTDTYSGICLANSTLIYVFSHYTGGTWGTRGGITATAPFTWTTNDTINLSITFQLA